MIKKRHFAILVIILAVIIPLMLISCTRSGSVLKDGYYSAEASEFDQHGWKEYVTICVSDGRIALVEYDSFNLSGFIKSWDTHYMRVMNAASGTYPNYYTRSYGRQLLEDQGIENIDCITGATESYYTFLRLAEVALANARKGNIETSQVRFGNSQNNGY